MALLPRKSPLSEEALDTFTPPVEDGSSADPSGDSFVVPEEPEGRPTPVLDDNIAGNRVKKYDFALGKQSPGFFTLTEETKNLEHEENRRIEHNNYLIGRANELRFAEGKRAIARGEKDLAKLQGLMTPVPGMHQLGEVDLSYENSFAQRVLDLGLPSSMLSRLESHMSGVGDDLTKFQSAISDPNNETLNVQNPRVLGARDNFQKVIAARQGFQRLVEDRLKEWENRSFLGKAGAFAIDLVPFWSWSAIWNSESDKSVGGFLPGQIVGQQIQYLYSVAQRNPEEAVALAKKAIDYIAQSSPLSAMEFSKALLSYSSSQRVLDNAGGIAQLLSAPFDAALVAQGVGKLANIAKVSSKLRFSLPDVVDASGKLEQAAELRALDKLETQALSVHSPKQWADFAADAPGIVNPALVAEGASPTSKPYADRLVAFLKQNASRLVGGVADASRIQRTEGEALKAALEQARREIPKQYPHVEQSIIRIEPIADIDTLSNVPHIGVDIGAPRRGKTGTGARDRGELSPRSFKAANENPSTIEDDIRIAEGFVLGTKTPQRFSGNIDVTRVTEFQTAKGSTYRVNPDGTTTRNKAARSDPGHEGDFGPKPSSAKTYYVDPKDAQRLAPPNGSNWRVVDHGDGTISIATKNSSGKWGIASSQRNILVSSEPKKGLSPIELWGKSSVNKKPAYDQLHLGNEITSVGRASAAANDVDLVAVDFGGKGATLYTSPKAANLAAREIFGFEEGSYKVLQHGDGYFIRIVKPIDESNQKVRDALKIETKGSTPRNLLNMFVGALRGYDHLLDVGTQLDRTTTVFGTSYLRKLYGDALQEAFGPLKKTKQNWNDFTEFMNWQLKTTRPGAEDALPGWKSSNLGEFEQHWYMKFDRVPTENETRAYFAYQQLLDFDLMLRNVQQLRNKQRLGLENHTLDFSTREVLEGAPPKVFDNSEIRFTANDNTRNAVRIVDLRGGESGPKAMRGPRNDTVLQGANTQASVTLEGKHLVEMPWKQIDAVDDAGLLIWDSSLGGMKYARARYIRSDPSPNGTSLSRAEINNMLRRGGYKLLQITKDGEDALRGAQGLNEVIDYRPVNFILVKGTKTSPLSLNQIPKREGGHLEFLDGHFVKQPKIKEIPQSSVSPAQAFYNGDTTLLHFLSGKDGGKYTKLLNEARELWHTSENGSLLPSVQAKAKADLNTFVADNFPHIYPTGDAFIKAMGEAGVHSGTPFYLVRKGQDVSDAADLRSILSNPQAAVTHSGRSSWNLFRDGEGVAYSAERDSKVMSISPSGQMVPARTVDATQTLFSAAADIIKSGQLADYKIKSVERFMAEFGHLLDTSNIRRAAVPNVDAQAEAMTMLLNPKWKAGVDKRELMAAKAFRRSVVTLLNTQTEFGKAAELARLRIAEEAFDRMGERGYKIANSALELPLIKDPVHFARSFAFHQFMGRGNIAQFLTQLNSVVSMSAITGDPRRVISAGGTVGMMRALEMTAEPSVIRHVAERAAATFGWKSADHLLEARKAMIDTGFHNVGREVTFAGDFAEGTELATRWGKINELGLQPYQQAEKLNRQMSWYLAYQEWRGKNLEAKFTEAAKKSVLERANVLANNMSVASDSPIQSFPGTGMMTQFLSHTMRMSEMTLTGLIGTRTAQLSRPEAARLLLSQMVMYGVPVGAGLATLTPLYDVYKKQVLADPKLAKFDESTVGKLLGEGLMSYAAEALTGERWNVPQKYGTGGFRLLQDLILGDNDKRVKALLGPGLSSVYDATMGAYPVLGAGLASIRGDYKFSGQDWADVISTAGSGPKSVVKLYYALQYHKYFQRDLGTLDDVSSHSAVFSFITGLTPQGITNAYLELDVIKAKAEAQKYATQQATRQYNLAYTAIEENRIDDALNHFKNADLHMSAGNLDMSQRAEVFRRANNTNVSMIDRVGNKFSGTNPELQELFFNKLQQRLNRKARILGVEEGQ